MVYLTYQQEFFDTEATVEERKSCTCKRCKRTFSYENQYLAYSGKEGAMCPACVEALLTRDTNHPDLPQAVREAGWTWNHPF
jgi:uncharacterized protein CbrC (UPF0167 family)